MRPVVDASDDARPGGQSRPGTCRNQVVVGVPEGDIGHQSLEVDPTNGAVGKVEQAAED